MAARKVVRRNSQLIVLVALTLPTGAQSLEVFGYAGVLGEWELTAKVTEKDSSGTKEFSGPFIMSYVGICTVDGPEERTGEIRLRISEILRMQRYWSTASNVVTADDYQISFPEGMNCPDRPEIPLKLWVK